MTNKKYRPFGLEQVDYGENIAYEDCPKNKRKLFRISVSSILCIPFKDLARMTISLPIFGVVFCVGYSMWTDLEASTRTHCGVRNWLPSLSAAMGGFSLSLTVWRICIALHAGPRFLVTGMYYGYLKSIIYGKYILWARITCLLNFLENLGLVGLTYVSSKDNYYIHEKFFLMFMLCSELYMILLCGLLTLTRNIPQSHIETISLAVKKRLVMVNLFSFFLAAYTFVRHNSYCEEGMYTLFALFEYIVVLSNMGFHMTAVFDFHDKQLTIGPCGVKLL